MRLKYVEIQGFRSFKNKTRIDFPDKGLVLIRGKSGVGKSNLFLAIAYALDICPVPSTKLKSWYSEKSFQVEIGLEDTEGLTIVRRGKENCILSPRGEIKGARAVSEAIPQITGLSPEVLSAVTYRVQRTPGTFLSRGDGEKKEFLGSLIPLLSQIERAVEFSESRLKELNLLKSPISLKLESLASNKTQLLAAKEMQNVESDWESRKQLLLSQRQEIIDVLESNKSKLLDLQESLTRKINALEEDEEIVGLKNSMKGVSEQLAEATQKEKQKRFEFDQTQSRIRTQVTELKKALWTASQEISQEESCRQKLAKLENDKCPTCSQPWKDNQAAKRDLLNALEKIEKLKANTPALQEVIFKMETSAGSWMDDPLVKALQRELEESKTRLNECILSKKNVIQDAGADKRRELETAIIHGQAAIQKIDFEVRSEDVRYNEKISIQAKMQKMLDENDLESLRLTEELSRISTEIVFEEQVVKILGKTGFLGSIFDQILAEIEQEMNDMLLQMSNSQSISIRFKTETQTQKGTVKKVIVPTVFIDGNETDLATGPSGGQQSAIELIADLAVLRVVERRTGKTPGWLLQDEVIIGQGTETSINALEILGKFAEEKLVLVIDHSSEVKELFQKVIDISIHEGVSVVT